MQYFSYSISWLSHSCVAPSECLTGNVDLREDTELRTAEEIDEMMGFCEKIEILELSQDLSFGTRSGKLPELICCDEKDIARQVEPPPSPECRHFLGHRWY